MKRSLTLQPFIFFYFYISIVFYQVVEKGLFIQEKEKLYQELKAILARQPGPEVCVELFYFFYFLFICYFFHSCFSSPYYSLSYIHSLYFSLFHCHPLSISITHAYTLSPFHPLILSLPSSPSPSHPLLPISLSHPLLLRPLP